MLQETMVTRRGIFLGGAGAALVASPSFPLGLVRYRATFDSLEPYERESYAFGKYDKSDLPLWLDRVREITKVDQYGNIPNS